MYYTYIIKGCESKVYIGVSEKNLRKKIQDHREGTNGAFKIKKPFSLIFVSKVSTFEEGVLKKLFILSMIKAGCITFNRLGKVSKK